MKLIITESRYKILTESINAHPNYILQQLKHKGIGDWIYKKNGLNLENLVNDILKDKKTNIKSEEIDKFIEGAKILFDNGKIKQEDYTWFVNNYLPNEAKLIYNIKGEWHPVNKLNTNYSDLVVLLTDLLFESWESNDFVKEILEIITKNGKPENIKNILLSNKLEIQKLFIKRYLLSPEDLYSYVENNVRLSKIGETSETEVRELFIDNGWKLIYQGGNGDFIDMKFSVDLIMETPEGKIKTIQVKTGKSGAETFWSEYSLYKKHQAVDILMYSENNKYFRVDLKK